MSDPLPKVITPGKYLHTKSGNYYEVVGIALHSETLEQLVIYRPLYQSKFELFARPHEMFTEKVMIEGILKPRFQKIND